MGKIVIKKRVNLDFLGEDYKDGYLVFKSLAIKDYEPLMKKVEQAEKESDSLNLILEVLKSNFIEGKFPVDDKLADVEKTDIEDFDMDTVVMVFERMTGRNPDPK